MRTQHKSFNTNTTLAVGAVEACFHEDVTSKISATFIFIQFRSFKEQSVLDDIYLEKGVKVGWVLNKFKACSIRVL